MAADWDTSGIHERRVDERVAPQRRRGWLGGRRRTAGVLTGLVSVAIIAGFIWSGRDRAPAEGGGEPPLIQAEEGPVRVVPEKPGGLEVPHRDKLVYQRVPGGEEDQRLERLLPPPEEPLPPPVDEPAASPPETTREVLPPPPPRERLAGEQAPGRPAPAPADPAARPAPSAAKPPVRAEAPATPPAKTKTAEAPPAPAGPTDAPRSLIPQPQPPAPPRTAAAQPDGGYLLPSESAPSAARSGAGSAPARGASPTPPADSSGYVLPSPAPTPAAGGGSYLVQLAAVSTAEQAQAAWSRLRGGNGDLLAGLSPSYARADLGAKGVVYRLRAGPVQGETRARALCAQLAGRKVDCMVVRAGG